MGGELMGRDTIIQFYTTESDEEWLKSQADAADQSLSEYCYQVVAAHIERKQEEQQYRRYGVDQQIELAIDEIQDETVELLREFRSETGARLEGIHRLRTIYVMALWRLFKDDFAQSEQKAALKYGVKHAGSEPSANPEIRPLLLSDEGELPANERGALEPTPTETSNGESE